MESPPERKRPSIAPVLIQIGVALCGMIGIVFAPPAQGGILLVPLTALAQARLPIAALDGHTLLLGAGPLPGSLVVIGGRPNLAWTMLRLGVLPIAASPAGCGRFPEDAPRA